MIYTDNRNDIRQMYFDAWQAANQGHSLQSLQPLQQQIVDVILLHPEYQSFLSQADNINQDFDPESGQSNPFLHMGMHIAIKEQLSCNQPAGIVDIYQSLLLKNADQHDVQHQFMECLAETLWEAQSQQKEPDMQAYLERLKRLSAKR